MAKRTICVDAGILFFSSFFLVWRVFGCVVNFRRVVVSLDVVSPTSVMLFVMFEPCGSVVPLLSSCGTDVHNTVDLSLTALYEVSSGYVATKPAHFLGGRLPIDREPAPLSTGSRVSSRTPCPWKILREAARE